MILLDTNVVSEPLKSRPSSKVIEWLDSQAAETLHLSTVSYAELRFGVLRLPHGKRKNDLAAEVEQVLKLFKDRTLTFDLEAAEHLAQILARTEKIGRKTPAPDAYIAAIAMTRGFAVATRNVDHFRDTGVSVINPWE
jgi:predicted nucleic acid-binding protein